MRPCLVCGVPSAASRCAGHAAEQVRRRTSPRSRGYDAVWDTLSRRARRLQPWCLECGAEQDLTVDHLPSAWERKAAGKSIRLRDVAVLCRRHNAAKGSTR